MATPEYLCWQSLDCARDTVRDLDVKLGKDIFCGTLRDSSENITHLNTQQTSRTGVDGRLRDIPHSSALNHFTNGKPLDRFVLSLRNA